ncbi:conserved hypothetical protein [Methylobacterium nodulans ORS 2060]|uniref:Uncharacterized protein n=1 Tax=Methylobacterium nodulans (strain LMG 21967 / CNCM I-2342 / ORS 2060) TaxID=460265 RepID=B8ISB4_METNO|nr:hypothetical protein [Methylobacterium nodulans]ACL58754.1 conserved hypothetical protein [Methylobacterium nodulans ORS 2060]
MLHKYKVRQLVHLSRTGFSDQLSNAGRIYEVTRLMPADQTGEVSYRIKEFGSGWGERAVLECEISARV